MSISVSGTHALQTKQPTVIQVFMDSATFVVHIGFFFVVFLCSRMKLKSLLLQICDYLCFIVMFR